MPAGVVMYEPRSAATHRTRCPKCSSDDTAKQSAADLAATRTKLSLPKTSTSAGHETNGST
eukprot:3016402-Alexandrium_andersonii.AAC.1